MTISNFIQPRNTPQPQDPLAMAVRDPLVQAGLPVVKAAVQGNPEAQQIVSQAAPQEALVLASAANQAPPQPQQIDLNSILNPNVQQIVAEGAAGADANPAATSQASQRNPRIPGVRSNIPGLIQGAGESISNAASVISDAFGQFIAANTVSDDMVTSPENISIPGTQAAATAEAADDLEEVADDAGVDEDTKVDINEAIQGAVLGSGRNISATNPEGLLSSLEAAQQSILDDPEKTPEDKRKAFEFFQDPRLWSAVTGLLVGLAGGASLQDSILYATIGAQAGQDVLDAQDEKDLAASQAEADRLLQEQQLSLDEHKAISARISAQARWNDSVKERNQQEWYKNQSQQLKDVFNIAHKTLWKEYELTKDITGQGTRPAPSEDDVRNRANTIADQLGLEGRFETAVVEDVPGGAPTATGLDQTQLSQVKSQYENLSDERKQAFVTQFANQLTPEQMSFITGE